MRTGFVEALKRKHRVALEVKDRKADAAAAGVSLQWACAIAFGSPSPESQCSWCGGSGHAYGLPEEMCEECGGIPARGNSHRMRTI